MRRKRPRRASSTRARLSYESGWRHSQLRNSTLFMTRFAPWEAWRTSWDLARSPLRAAAHEDRQQEDLIILDEVISNGRTASVLGLTLTCIGM